MRSLCVVFALFFATPVFAQDAQTVGSATEVALDRGLDFLAKDAVKWRNDHQCVSCHHAALVIWSMHEGKQRNRSVDEPLLVELTKWVAENGDGKTSLPRPPNIPKALNTKAIYFTLGLAAIPQPDSVSRAGMNKMLATVEGDQLENGSWASWPETKPPFFGNSDETMTVLASLVLLSAAEPDDMVAKAALDKGIQWLASTKSDDDPQSIALRLILWQRLGRPSEELQPLIQHIRLRQNSDGGWSQSPEMPSDAWATGQALYALANAGLKSTEPMIARAHTFLITTQREDGSWLMSSRLTKPGAPPANSLIPIIGGGSAWAVIGLARSL